MNPARAPRAESGFPTELTARCVLLLVLGLVALALRVVSVFIPRAGLVVLTLLFGWFALADGAGSLAIGLWRIRPVGMLPALFLRGALGLGLGVFALTASNPAVPAQQFRMAVVNMARLFALWTFLSGALDLAIAAGALRGEGGRWLAVAGGVSAAIAIILAISPPGAIPFLVLWVAGYAILMGILLLIRITRLV